MIRKIMSSQKGASSIFVVLLLVVLMVFGIAALTVALSNMRLGQKVSDWNSTYYYVEGLGWERFAQIDKAVHAAYEKADEDIVRAVISDISALAFETAIEAQDGIVTIAFETFDQSSSIGISAILELDTNDKSSLRAVQWREIQ